MKYLWILRHGKAAADGPDGDDHSRPLTGRGRRQTVQVAEHLARAVETGPWLLGERFSAADVMLGSVIAVGLFTKRLPAEAALVAYNTRLGARPAFQKAAAINWPPELFAPS